MITGSSVVSRSPTPMVQCDHEEADTRIAIHVKLQATYSGLDIWVAFGMGKHFQYYHINTICQNLGEPLCQALPFYQIPCHNFWEKVKNLLGRHGNHYQM